MPVYFSHLCPFIYLFIWWNLSAVDSCHLYRLQGEAETSLWRSKVVEIMPLGIAFQNNLHSANDFFVCVYMRVCSLLLLLFRSHFYRGHPGAFIMFLSSFLPFSSLEALQLPFLAHVSGFVCFLDDNFGILYLSSLHLRNAHCRGGCLPVHPN